MGQCAWVSIQLFLLDIWRFHIQFCHSDIDECRTRESVCHRYAECINEPGSFRCSCIEGFVGDGNNCESGLFASVCTRRVLIDWLIELIQWKTSATTFNARPMLNVLWPIEALVACAKVSDPEQLNQCFNCFFQDGYFGDGIRCELVQNDVEDCRTLKICDLNAECKLNRLIGRYTCVCIGGYRGDGIVCTEESESCEKFNNCGNNAECISDEYSNHAYYCSCNQGYVGDGYTCVAESKLFMQIFNATLWLNTLTNFQLAQTTAVS